VETAALTSLPKGHGPADLRELSLELSAWMFFLGDRTRSVEEGRSLAEAMVATGQALEKLRQGIRLQGGDARVVDEPHRLPQARLHAEVTAASAGYITATNCENLGTTLAMIGEAGKGKKTRSITASAWSFTNASATAWKRTKKWSRFITIATPNLPKRRILSAAAM
jgi:thymidine phosphorylase